LVVLNERPFCSNTYKFNLNNTKLNKNNLELKNISNKRKGRIKGRRK